MTWWQTVLVGSIPALITLVGLLVQQTILGNRERERWDAEAQQRELDRARADRMRELDRLDSLDNHWREERKQAHVDFLSTLNEAHRKYADLWYDAHQVDETDRKFIFAKLGARPEDSVDAAYEALTTLELVASEASLEAAREAANAITGYYNHVTMLVMENGARNARAAVRFDETLNQFMSALNRYREAVREELGTVAGPSTSPKTGE